MSNACPINATNATGFRIMTAATALTIVADHPAAYLSPARSQLADHLAALAKLQSEADRASAPVARLRDQLERANQQLASAEAHLAQIEAGHAAAIAEAAKAGSDAPAKAPVREKALAQREATRRTKAAIEAALLECEGEHDRSTIAVRDAQVHTEAFVLAVMAEEHRTALARVARTFAEHDAALVEAEAIRTVIFERAQQLQHRAPEQANAVFVVGNAMLSEIDKASLIPAANLRHTIAAWAATMARLAVDATAAAP